MSIDNSILSTENTTTSRDHHQQQQQQQRNIEDVELISVVPKRPSVLRVPSISNQDIATNNNDVSLT